MNTLTAIQPTLAHHQAHSFYDTIAQERDALSNFLAQSPQLDIEQVVPLLARQDKPIVFIGIGKSGHIAAKVAATFSSLDMPAMFVNAGEAAHGDLGAVKPQSVVVLFSNSGTTEELVRLLPLLKARGCDMVAIVGRKASPLARTADYVILAEIEREADPQGMAPTSSTTLQLAIGDALAIATSQHRGFTREDFLRHHPAGLLGRQMIPIASLMRQGDDLPKVQKATPLLELLTVMSSKRMGAACVVGKGDQLLGLIVDGDVRRHLQSGADISAVTAGDVMQPTPHTVRDSFSLGHVLSLRKRAPSAWLVMPVVDEAGRLKGMIHAQDVLG